MYKGIRVDSSYSCFHFYHELELWGKWASWKSQYLCSAVSDEYKNENKQWKWKYRYLVTNNLSVLYSKIISDDWNAVGSSVE